MKYSMALVVVLGISAIITGCNIGDNSANTQVPNFTVTNIQVGKMNGDTQASEFSTTIRFTYTGAETSSWQFGFYMPRSFNSLTSGTENINPNLIMQICAVDSSGSCIADESSPLEYQHQTSITSLDLSAGYTTILAPTGYLILRPSGQYKISLLHNNQWNAANYSALPQNFFIISGNTLANSTPNSGAYTLLDYNAAATNNAVNNHINANWNNSSTVNSSVNIVPTPVSYIRSDGAFTIGNGIVIHNQLNSDNTVASFFQKDLGKDLSILATIDNNTNISINTGIIIKTINNPTQIANNPEGYIITITSNAIIIEAENNTGVFYALQSLRQLWNQSATLAGASIIDYPRFKYRGVLLDVSRHFFSLNEIKSLIDIAATHKLNTLHMHFADDEGFRLGLDGYSSIPTQADTRGYGTGTIGLMFIQGNLDISNFNNEIYPYVNTNYSGTYSIADLQQMISYANQRGITIIPEIDMPGHARAMIKAFPDQLVDSNDLSQFISVQGYSDDVLPVCTYNTSISVGPGFTSLTNNIIQATARLFSNQTTVYAINNEISVGGDEVSNGAWTNDSSCSGSWAGLSALEKSHKFFQLLSQNNQSLKLSGWQQYVQNDDDTLGTHIIPAANSGHVWIWNTSGAANGQAQARTLAEAGYPVVLDYADQNYFDLAYTPAITEPGFNWAAQYVDTYSALDSALTASETINTINMARQANILGLEGTLWSENLATYNHMIYMALPKMAGLSEAAWSAVSVTNSSNLPNWQSLANRLGCGQGGFLSYLHSLYGVYYRGYPNGIHLEVPVGFCQT